MYNKPITNALVRNPMIQSPYNNGQDDSGGSNPPVETFYYTDPSGNIYTDPAGNGYTFTS